MTTTPVPPPVAAEPVPAPGRCALAVWAVVACWLWSPLGLVLGLVARRKVQRTGQKGARWAMTAIVLGGVFLAVDVLVAHELPVPLGL